MQGTMQKNIGSGDRHLKRRTAQWLKNRIFADRERKRN